MQEGIEYWIALSLVPGIGTRTGRSLLDKLETPSAIFQAERRELEAIGLGLESVESLQSGEMLDWLMCRSILAKADRVVSENVNHLDF